MRLPDHLTCLLWNLYAGQEATVRTGYGTISSVQFSHSVTSNSLWPHGLQHTRPPCPSPAPGACSNSCPSSRWCHPTISSFVVPFSRIQSFPAPGSFSMSQFFPSGGQSTGVSASVLPMILISFRMDWLDFLAVQGTLKSLLQHHSSKVSIFQCSAFYILQLLHPYMTTGKTTALTRWTFADKVMSLLFNVLSRLVTGFLPRSKRLLIHGCSHHSQWFWSPKKIVSVSIVSPSICQEVMGLDAMILSFLNVEFEATFFTLLFHFHQQAL